MTTTNPTPSKPNRSAKTLILIGLIVLLAILVPVGLYFISTISFTSGTTGANLSVPDTGVTAATPPPRAAPNNAARDRTVADIAALAGSKMMDLSIVDQTTHQPIVGLAVRANGRTRFNGVTDANGHVKVTVPKSQGNPFNIRVTGKGYIPERLVWANYNPELSGPVPDTYAIQMGKSTKISGKIIDDSGNPVAGATIALEFTMKGSDPHVQLDVVGYNRDKPLKSGDDGGWVFNGAPANCEQINLIAWDNHHVVDDFWIAQPFTPVSKLYDGTATFTLHQGVTVEGTVVDVSGAPISGATALLGQNADSYNGMPPETTDSAGKFSYVLAPGHNVILSIQAKGFGPEMQQFTLGSEKKNVTFTLSKPHILRGKVVNSAGLPVSNARLYLQQWRGYRTINANFQTDASGNFHWNNAPADSMTFSVSAPNLRGVDNAVLRPDTDNVVKLGSAVHIRGTVTDAQTGKPIDNIHLTMGIVFNADQQQVNWQPGWNSDNGVKPGGRFDFTDDYSGIAVRINAPGYMPVESRVIRASEGDATLDLKMKPGKDIVVTIHSPDGSPVSGAMAIMALPGQPTFVVNGRQSHNNMTNSQSSGADGHVSFSPQSGPYKIGIFADAGYAEADQDTIAKSQDIKLIPWGRIEGRMMVGSKPAAGQMVDVTEQNMRGYDQQVPQIMNQLSASVGDDGHFSLDRVPAGTWMINRRIPFGNNGWTYSPLKSVEVSSGQTTTTTVGGTGRPIIGKVLFPPEIVGKFDWNYSECAVGSRIDRPESMMPHVPDDIRNASPEKQRAWLLKWRDSDEGKAYFQKLQKTQSEQRRFPFTVNPDGSFRIEDVSAGDYELHANLRTLNPDGPDGQRRITEVGMASIDFTIPEMPSGRSDDPLDVGSLQVMTLERYKVGDTVKDIPLKSSDGKNIKFSDYHGKFLLVNFHQGANWALPALSAIYDGYSPDKLAMLTINFNPGWLGGGLSSGIRWQQATFVPNGPELNVVSTAFGFDGGPPGAWLIDPDGKVVAADLHGAELSPAVSAALGPPTTQPATQPAIAP